VKLEGSLEPLATKQMVDSNSTIKALLASKFSQEQAIALCKIFSDTFSSSYKGDLFVLLLAGL
jgi:hypothetical protein